MRHGRHRLLSFRQKGIFNVFQLPLPTKDYLFTVGFFKPVFNTPDQILLGLDTQVPQGLAGELAEEAFNQIQPRSVSGSEDEIEAVLSNAGQIFHCLR